jgi:hypothetical protein
MMMWKSAAPGETVTDNMKISAKESLGYSESR